MQKVNGWQTTDTKWWENLIWALGPGELKTFLRTKKWTLLPCLNTIGPVGKRSKCRSLLTTSRDGHQVMIIPLITLKVSSSFKHTLINTWKTQQKLKFNDQLDACLNFFLAVDLIQHKYSDILYIIQLYLQ